MAHHEKRLGKLKSAIERIQTGKPLATAEDLMLLNVEPGKKMGILLKLSEKISINEELQDKEKVLQRLKKTAEWLKNN